MLGCWSILGLPVVMMGGEKANPKLMAESPFFRRMGSCSAGQGKWPHPTSSRNPCLGIVGPRPLRFPKYRPGPFPARGPPGAPTVFALPPRPAPSVGWALGTGWGEGADGQARPDFYQRRSDSYQRRDGPQISAGLSAAPFSTSTTADVGTLVPSLLLRRLFSGAADGSRRFVGPRSPPLSAACRAPTRIHPSRSPD